MTLNETARPSYTTTVNTIRQNCRSIYDEVKRNTSYFTEELSKNVDRLFVEATSSSTAWPFDDASVTGVKVNFMSNTNHVIMVLAIKNTKYRRSTMSLHRN